MKEEMEHKHVIDLLLICTKLLAEGRLSEHDNNQQWKGRVQRLLEEQSPLHQKQVKIFWFSATSIIQQPANSELNLICRIFLKKKKLKVKNIIMRLLSNKEESLGKVIASTHLAISAFIRLQHERIIITSDCISWLAAQASV